MTAEQLLIENWRVLPTDKQQQVIDYVQSLRTNGFDLDTETESSPRRRTVPPELHNSVKILGDIVGPIVDEEDWECLKEDWEIMK